MPLIPPFFSDCAVAIGVDDPDEDKRKWTASGFLYGQRVQDRMDRAKGYRVYLVTNRHVLEQVYQAGPVMYLRFNPQAHQPAQEYKLDLFDEKSDALWRVHPDSEIDIGVIPVDFERLREDAMQAAFFRNDEHAATLERLREMDVAEGDSVYVLGFPLGLVGKERSAVIIRGGSIARIRGLMEGDGKEFLIDAFVFPGNSGGPVVTGAQAVSTERGHAVRGAYLVGVVKGYVAYEETAISMQSKRPRIIFEENSGLASVIPIECVEQTINEGVKVIDASTDAGRPRETELR